MNIRGGLVCLSLSSLFACGDDSSSQPDAGISIDAPPSRTVEGVFNLRYVTPTGEVVMPVNLTGASVTVLTLPELRIIIGTVASNGTFQIRNVPEGPYYLRLGSHYFERDDNMVDVSFDVVGHPDYRVATSATHLIFDVTDLATWQADDEIQMFSPQAGTTALGMNDSATGVPAVGATSLVQFDYDLRNADIPTLIDGTTAGDRVQVTQLSTTTSDAWTYRTPTRTFKPPQFQISNGGTANIAGAFTTVDPTNTLGVIWDRPAFDAELTAHSPRANVRNYGTLKISALLEGATRSFYHDAPEVVVFQPGYQSGTSIVTANWPYGDPYPVEWTRIANARYETYRYIDVGTAHEQIFASITSLRDLSTLTPSTPIVPLVGAVVDPKINGVDAFSPSPTGIGLTPTLTWTAPAIGVATRYYIYATEVLLQNGSIAFDNVALFETAKTQVVIPPDVLKAGKSYIFHFGARATPADLNATPYAFALPDDLANVISAIATP